MGFMLSECFPHLFCFATNVCTAVIQFGMEFLSERIQLILSEHILAVRHMLSIFMSIGVSKHVVVVAWSPRSEVLCMY